MTFASEDTTLEVAVKTAGAAIMISEAVVVTVLFVIVAVETMTDCSRQYTQSRSPPPAYRPARAAASPTTLRLPPPRADRYKGKAGEPRKCSSPGAARWVTAERRTGRTDRRCLSWWVLPQEGISFLNLTLLPNPGSLKRLATRGKVGM